ncbi:PH (Pleckstrin Homology) domain-containing protein [Herbihabitans rhizosphaerae]|uniref:PH (Pleckstrin Homology) domain-containing protein n=1 Tax=Herbihabitans rhizosphaerae TaxID=1872711 RepID=A0A4Q7KQI5_9PSEU|nr:PH domain-containing protein [Herbihabitans rhizosphaerae]RZS39079.1 PH (Pleckstrin Homology) domain-containing protein [Herbihabitans rhizosphaerae]
MPDDVSNQVETPQRLVFRIPPTALLGVFLLALGCLPVAFVGVPGLQAIFLVPLAAGWWVVRTRTVADRDKLVVRTVFGRRSLSWNTVVGLRITKGTRVDAVVGDKDSAGIRLPSVRPRHLPALALISGGRVPDPTEEPERADDAEE